MSEFTENLRAPAIVGSKIIRKKGINRVQFAPDTLPGMLQYYFTTVYVITHLFFYRIPS